MTVGEQGMRPSTPSARSEVGLPPHYLHAMFLKRVLHYLDPRTLFGKADPNGSLRFMHGINRISILLFLFCITVMVIRACSR